jgi:hypothetical protein
MSGRLFGISIGTILLVVAVVVITRMWGSSIPGVSSIPTS